MCLGNRAESSARYINGQLTTLYDNARHCSMKHSDGLKPSSSIVEYSTCLYEYYGPGKHVRPEPKKTDLSFYVQFGAPRLEFVCNHEVILFLKLKEGHYDLEFTKANHKRTHVEHIKDIILAYRVEFNTKFLNGFECSEIGNEDSYSMSMHILNISSAHFVLEHSHIPGVTDASDDKSFLTRDKKLKALQYYVKQYLHIFKCAGHHVLYSLPDYDNLAITTAHVDYSAISKHTLAVDKIFGVDISAINLYLRNLWLQAAAHIDDHGSSHDHHEHRIKHYLAEHRSVWTDEAEDIHIHMFTGPLRVHAMCKREVILYLDLQDILFHIGGTFSDHPHHKFAGWKIAFIVDVICEEEHHIKRVKLDIGSARYCEHLSFFGTQVFEEDIMIRIRTTLIRYLVEYYILLIKKSGHHCVFEHDPHKPAGPICPVPEDPSVGGEEDPLPGCHCPDVGSCGHTDTIRWGIIWKNFIDHSHCGDFDIVTAVTQGSINSAFFALWEAAQKRVTALGSKHTWDSLITERDTCIADYSFVHEHHGEEVFFSASFQAPIVQLNCKEGSHKVMVYFTISEGFFKILGTNKSIQPGAQSYSFSNWRLAFEVELKLVDVKEESISDIVLKRFGLKGDHSFKQLILDFSAARLRDDYCYWPGMLEEDDCRILSARRCAVAHYFSQHYFAAFKRAHHHVLYTFPLFDKNAHGHHRHSITSLKFQVVPFVAYDGCCIDGIYGKQRAIFDRNMIVFLGMVDHHHMPKGVLPHINWVGGHGEMPHGTVCLSKKTFLDERILKKLEAINKETTIFASMGSVERGEWKPELTTWKKHHVKQHLPCHFVAGTPTPDSLEFHWHNRDQWTYTHDGDLNGNGLYKVKCTTHNTVSVPTIMKNDCLVTIRGRVDLSLAYEGDGHDWDAEMHTTWSASVKFISDNHGLRVHVASSKIVPEFHNSRCEGSLGHSTHEQMFKQLRDHFPHAIDFTAIHHELKACFEGCWSGLYVDARDMIVSKPVFNKRGDFILELVPKHVEVKIVASPKKPGLIARAYSVTKDTVSGVLNGHANGYATTNGHSNGVSNGHSFQKHDEKNPLPATPTTPSSGIFSHTLSRSSSKTSMSSIKSTSSSKTISSKMSGVFHSVVSKPATPTGGTVEQQHIVDVPTV